MNYNKGLSFLVKKLWITIVFFTHAQQPQNVLEWLHARQPMFVNRLISELKNTPIVRSTENEFSYSIKAEYISYKYHVDFV